ncbi:sensor histidine kinase [Hahella sp. SMD15-11]|uniref:histidine kinase n=1 Tax=Thermohahella caldifontis TaxID=3142973 RepID=A0AB39USM4_9GAMM
MRWRPRKLKTRMILIIGLLALLQTSFIGVYALRQLHDSLDDQISLRALQVARTIAAMPEVVRAVQARDSEYLQPLARRLAEELGARFIVIGDRQGIRLAHPTPSRLGKPMYDDEGDHNEIALVQGRPYVTKAVGSLGPTMRGKAPVFDPAGEEVVGIVSVGFTLEAVEQVIRRYRDTLLVVVLMVFAASVLGGVWIAQHVKRAIFGLEPEQIGLMFKERNATLASVREGIIAINSEGRITTFNSSAKRMLGLPEDCRPEGRPLSEVLPDSGMSEVLTTGTPEFDREVTLQGRVYIVNRIPLEMDGQMAGVVSSFRPRDELDRITRRLNQMEQYADSLRAQSHEYSNKLHTIAGLIQMGATEDALALIGQETRGHQALMDILIAAVPDPLLAGCLVGKYNRAREMGLVLVLHPESHMRDLPEALERDKLVSILGNLIDNALEATRDHTGRGGVVSVSMSDFGDELIFEIEDQGPGIPPEARETIFHKGVTSKAESGHGYGLHLVRQWVALFHGTITVEPADEGGTRFTVYLPKQR